MPELQVLTTGIAFGESPRWHDGRLWFSDWGAQEVVAVDLDGGTEMVLRAGFPSFPMCIEFLPDGSLLIVSGRQGRLLRRERDGSLATYAELGSISLIVAESYSSKLTALDIAADGSLSNQRVWADLAGGVPDGICLDAEGAVWYADVPNKRCVRHARLSAG